MKQRLTISVMAVLAVALMLPPAWSQSMATVKGKCLDAQGKPIAGATVEYANQDSGQKYSLKTNKKGEFFSLGVAPGKYKITLIQNGQVLFYFNGVQVQLGSEENETDFNLQKEQAAAKQRAESQLTPEQKAQQEKVQKENATIKTLNEKLAAASAAEQAGNYDQAVSVLKEATTIDPNRDLLWFKLGDALRGSATKQTDATQKTQMYNDSIAAYQKALTIKPNDGAYLNNLGDVQAKAGKTDDAIKTFTQAAQSDPTHAAQYYFNLGAVLTNSGKVDDAVQAFDKAIAADPTKADAYYWKGVNLLGKATTDKTGKMTAPEGTAEAFNKYLELSPQGTYADAAKQMLSSIGATVETSFGKSKKKTTSKRQ
ncbi:MAG TPA: tetratricopeptide repeat protein [Terriglobales bacterium]|nr:tetratricopeptide repeat protein [Terriglobales bacterium]